MDSAVVARSDGTSPPERRQRHRPALSPRRASHGGAGFEALLKIGRNDAKQQFAQRVPPLAAEAGIEVTREECTRIYDDRSALVHGSNVDLSVPHELDEFGRLFALLQEALRRTVRRAIEDRAFAASLEDNAAITARWPTRVLARGGQERVI